MRLTLILALLHAAAAPAWPAVVHLTSAPAPRAVLRAPALHAAPTLRPTLAPLAAPKGLLASPVPVAPAVAVPAAAVAAGVPSAALPALQQTAAAIEASPAAPQAALDLVFENATRPESGGLVPGTSGAPQSNLAPSSSQPSRKSTPPQKPRSSLARVLKVGTIGATLSVAVTFGSMILSQVLGHQLAPNYQNPAEGVVTLTQALVFGVMAAGIGPAAEEVVFRSGATRVARKLVGWLPKIGEFWAPAALTSALFVVIHETGDPVLMASRFVGAMILARIYHKEGLPASIATHALFNGFLTVPLVAGIALGATAGTLAAMAAGTALIGLSLRFWKQLKAEGPVERAELTPGQTTALGSSILAGFLLIAMNPIWLAASIGLFWRRFFGAKKA